jgi:ArsR family transcriptional regulator
MGLSQPTISHHLRVLTSAGVLSREQRGTWAWFTLNPKRLKEISRLLI